MSTVQEVYDVLVLLWCVGSGGDGAMSQCRNNSNCPTSVIMANVGSVIMAKKIHASHNGEKREMGEGEMNIYLIYTVVLG